MPGFFTGAICTSSKFELPKGTELLSPIYWLYCEEGVEGSVEVELQHCALLEKDKCFKIGFVVCEVDKLDPPYQFKYHEAKFKSESGYMKYVHV